MSGVRPEWVAGTDFIMVHRELVTVLDGDYEAAMVLDRIRFRSGRDGWWVATAPEMQAETCLTEWKLKAAVKHLRDVGLIESVRVSSFDPTQKWRLVMEESSVPCGMETSDTGSVKEESSDTVKEESSDTSSKNSKNTSGSTVQDPEMHPMRAIRRDWQPSGGFATYLHATYPHVDIERRVREFVLWHMQNSKTSRSWEALLETWISRDEAEATDLEGTDDLGIPRTQRKTSSVQPAQPGDPDYFDPDLIFDPELVFRNGTESKEQP